MYYHEVRYATYLKVYLLQNYTNKITSQIKVPFFLNFLTILCHCFSHSVAAVLVVHKCKILAKSDDKILDIIGDFLLHHFLVSIFVAHKKFLGIDVLAEI